MAALTEFLSSKEVFIVVMVAISICVVGTIYFVLEKIYKSRKEVQTTDMENKIVRVSENRIVIEPAVEESIPVEKEEVVVPIVEEEKEIVSEPVQEVKEEKPLVIPIEEFEKQQEVEAEKEVIEELIVPTVETIYTEVKEQVEKEEKVEELVYTEIEPNVEEAKEELRRATEELMKTQEMQEQENIELTKFEEEQEENAIISMDELMQKSKVLYEQNEVTQYEDEGNEPISLKDLELRMNQIKIEAEKIEQEEEKTEVVTVQEEPVKVKLDDFNTVSLKDAYKEDRIFKSSPVISPIFGIEKDNGTTNIELENTANYEKFDDEIKKTNEFLAVLRDLQKKLD